MTRWFQKLRPLAPNLLLNGRSKTFHFALYPCQERLSSKRITMCPPMRANTENTSTGGLLPPVDFIYIASFLNRHGISCNPCHAIKAQHCLVCHAAPRVMVPDSRGCGSVRVKRRNTPCLGDCQENTTLSGGGKPPSPRKPTRLVGIMSLATGLLRLSVS